MDNLDIIILREKCKERKILWTKHASRRLQERNIYRKDVFNAIENGKIIEQYPNSYPYPACLILGYSVNEQPLHIVVGYDTEILYIITAYFPSTNKN